MQLGQHAPTFHRAHMKQCYWTLDINICFVSFFIYKRIMYLVNACINLVITSFLKNTLPVGGLVPTVKFETACPILPYRVRLCVGSTLKPKNLKTLKLKTVLKHGFSPALYVYNLTNAAVSGKKD